MKSDLENNADALRIWSCKFRGIDPGRILKWEQLKDSEQTQWLTEALEFNSLLHQGATR